MEARRQKSTAANLTEDLIFKILIWLPLYSILRFRCVCKSWYNLLDQTFINTKLTNLKLLLTKEEPVNHDELCSFSGKEEIFYSTQLSLMSNNKDAVEITYPFKKSSGSIQILGSCNGLVCASSDDDSDFYVWNPCTAEHKEIFGVKGPDRYINTVDYGFGYDSKTRDYKFVLIICKTSEDMVQSTTAEIYTLNSGSWRKYRSWVPYEVSNGRPGVFVNGTLHWLADTSSTWMEYEDTEPQVILTFNVEEEKFDKLLLPAELKDDFDDIFLNVLRGFLCLVCSVSNATFEIWEMKEYGVVESWCNLFKIDQQQLTTMGVPSFKHIRRAVSLTNSEILLEICDQTGKKWRTDVVRIDLEEKKVYEYMKDILQIEAYAAESRVSVNSGTFVWDEKVESHGTAGMYLRG